MTQKHTPTPWAIRSCDRFEGGEPVTEIYSTVTDEVIANDQTYYPQAVKPQNARLIVPAVNAYEELLAALKRINGDLSELITAEHDDHTPESNCLLCSALFTSYAAIAKASPQAQ